MDTNRPAFEILIIQAIIGNEAAPTASVRLQGRNGQVYSQSAIGNGPIDAVCRAIAQAVNQPNEYVKFAIASDGNSPDEIGQFTVVIKNPDGHQFGATVKHSDVVLAAAYAYIKALNAMIEFQEAQLAVAQH